MRHLAYAKRADINDRLTVSDVCPVFAAQLYTPARRGTQRGIYRPHRTFQLRPVYNISLSHLLFSCGFRMSSFLVHLCNIFKIPPGLPCVLRAASRGFLLRQCVQAFHRSRCG